MRKQREKQNNGPASGGLDPRIVRFVGRHRVMTLAASASTASGGASDGAVWCCNLFYAFLPSLPLVAGPTVSGGAFVFTSPPETEHARLFVEQPRVAGSVVLESKVVGRLQGLQFQGEVVRADSSPELLAAARGAYLKRFPFAAPMLSELWVVCLTRCKLTDNTLGFGTKLLWP